MSHGLRIDRNITSLISVTVVGRLIGQVFVYGTFILIANVLGPEALGVFTVGLLVLKFGGAVTQIGMSATTQKFIPIYRSENNDRKLTGVVIICLVAPFIAGLFLSGALYLLRPFLVPIVGSEILSSASVLVFGIPLFGVFSVGESASQGFKETKYAVYIRDFAQAGSAIFFVAIALLWSKSIFAISVAYLGSLFVAVLAVVLSLQKLGAFDNVAAPEFETKRILRYSLSALPKSLSGPLTRWIDIFVLSVLVTATGVGWYQASYQTATLLVFVLASVNSIFPPLVSDLYNRGEDETLQGLYTAMTKWTAVFTLYGTFYVIIFRRDILALFGPSFVNAEWVLVILALGRTVDALIGPSGYFLMMTGNERVEMLNSLGAAAINLVLNVFLILRFGIVGAAVATAISISLLNVVRLTEVRCFVGFWPYSWQQLINVLPLGIAASLMYVITSLDLGPMSRLLIGGTVSFPIFVLIFLYFAEDDELLRRSIGDI